MNRGENDADGPQRLILSKRVEIGMAALAFAVIFAAYFGVELQSRGLLTPTRLVWLIVCAALGGVAFGFGFWHLYLKRRRL